MDKQYLAGHPSEHFEVEPDSIGYVGYRLSGVGQNRHMPCLYARPFLIKSKLSNTFKMRRAKYVSHTLLIKHMNTHRQDELLC